MMSLLQKVFNNKLKHGNRSPIHLIKYKTNELHLVLPQLDFWIQHVVLHIIQTILCIILSLLIYKFIIQSRNASIKSKNHNDKNLTRSKKFLIGYGIIIPIAIMLPFLIIDHLGIENKTLRFSLLSLPNTIVFRCLEAMVSWFFADLCQCVEK